MTSIKSTVALMANTGLYIAGVVLVVSSIVFSVRDPIANVLAGLGFIVLSEWHDYRRDD